MIKLLIWLGEHLVGISAVLVFLAGYRKSYSNGRALSVLNLEINSRLSELIATSTAAAKALGIEEGRQLHRAEQNQRAELAKEIQ